MEQIIIEALQFATLAHDGQKRKGTDIPYIVHPYEVGMLLRDSGCDAETVAAGLLHDVLEDTPVTEDELQQRFGHRVTELVLIASEPDKNQSWRARKEHTIQLLSSVPAKHRLVPCADKISNVNSLIRDQAKIGDAVWERFNTGRRHQEWYYRSLATSIVSNLKPQEIHPLFNALPVLVNQCFGVESV